MSSSAVNMSADKRKTFSIKDKYDILMKIRNGVKRDQLLREYRLKSYSHLTQLVKNEKKIITKYESTSGRDSAKTFSVREAKHPKVENALVMWLSQMDTISRHKVTCDEIIAKAQEFADSMGIDFKPTNGYLNGFKRRHGLELDLKQRGVDTASDWSQQLSQQTSNYLPEEIYILSETALFYRALPFRTNPHIIGPLSAKKLKTPKDRLTLVLVTNADGSDRMCSLIGKTNNPRGLKSMTDCELDYYSQPNARIDATIYKKIICQLNTKMKELNKRIVLFVNKSRSHCQQLVLSNISFKYFPANVEIPDINRCFKMQYRKQLIELLIERLESGLEVTGTTCDLSICMRLIDTSLKSIPDDEIMDCFCCAKFDFNVYTAIKVEPIAREDYSVVWEQLKILVSDLKFDSFDDFVAIDDDESVELENELSDQHIIDLVINTSDRESDKSRKTNENQNVIKKCAISSAANLVKGLSCERQNLIELGAKICSVLTPDLRHVLASAITGELIDKSKNSDHSDNEDIGYERRSRKRKATQSVHNSQLSLTRVDGPESAHPWQLITFQ